MAEGVFMSKTKAAAFLASVALFAGAALNSCGDFSELAIPETISVKSNARYAGALGQKYYDLSEKFGDDFIKDLAKDAGGDVYKYVPNAKDNVLSYLLHKKVYDVPLDVSEYIGNMKLDDLLQGGFSFSKEIKLPEVKKSADVPVVAGAPVGTEVPFDIPIALTLEDVIKSATVGTGAITVKAEGSGSEIEIFDFSLDGVKTGGGGNFDKDDFADGSGSGSFIINKELNLSGAMLDIPASQIRAHGKLRVKSGPIAAATKLKFSIQIKTLSAATADLSKIGKFEMSDTTPNKTQLPAELVAYVKTVNFGQLSGGVYYKSDKAGNITTTKGLGKGIKFKAINSLPAGNDIDLIVKSDTFGIDKNAAITAKGNESVYEKSVADFGDIDVTDASKFGDKDNPAYIKFSVSLSDAQAFSNLEMGKTYKIAVSEPQTLFDWDRIEMDLSLVDPVADKADLSDFSIDSMMSEVDGELKKLADNCEFVSLPVYFFVQKPNGPLAGKIGDVTIKGEIFLEYKDSTSTTKKEYIAGSDGSPESMNTCDLVDWPASGQQFTKVFKTKGTDYSFMHDMADVLNERPKDLMVNYSMKIGNGSSLFSLYKAELDSEAASSGAISIAVDMAAVLKFKLNVATETDWDIYKIADIDMDSEKALMYRDSVSDTATYGKYAGAISYMRLNYNFINKAVDGLKATVIVDDKHVGEPDAAEYSGIYRKIEITGSDTSDDVINLSSAEIKAALTHFFKPKMTVTIPKGEVSVRRSAIESSSALGISPMVILQLNSSTAVDIKDIIEN